ncbi:MAG TPA: M20/M25/M40 family metallo-hydrolase [Gemmatimonadaceae bacterium]|nr:M20/M25/M40 family metallo-hydrolase [Gemmatimonadaceae bacterium]
MRAWSTRVMGTSRAPGGVALLLAAMATLAALAALAPPAAAQELDGRAARQAARAFREANEAAILREYTALLSLPNVASDSVNIRRNAAALVEMLRRRGATTRLLEVPGGPPSVYGEIIVPGATRTIILYAHYDGQPVDPKQWTGGAPFTPVLRDKALYLGGKDIPFPADGQRVDGEARVYARSASDDKGSIIAMLTALDALRSRGAGPSLNVKFFFEGEEEAGSGHLEAILTKYKELLKADAWLFCDGPVHQSGAQQLVFGLRGVTGLEITVFGPTRPLHSGHYGNWAPNPGMLLTHLLAGLRNDDGEILVPHFYDDVRPLSAAERRAIAGLPPVDSALRHSLGLARTEGNNALLAERIMRPALNLRGIRVGGVQELGSNTISTEAYASIDFRLVPNQTPARVRELVERHLRATGWHIVSDTPSLGDRLAYPRLVRLQWESGYPAQRSSMDDAFGRALVASVSDGAEQRPLLVPTLGGSGPSYLFTKVLGAPVVTLPIANYDNNQHAANENLRVQNLWNAIELYAGMLSRLGKEWAPIVP